MPARVAARAVFLVRFSKKNRKEALLFGKKKQKLPIVRT
jgi:hypothetical protein